MSELAVFVSTHKKVGRRGGHERARLHTREGESESKRERGGKEQDKGSGEWRMVGSVHKG